MLCQRRVRRARPLTPLTISSPSAVFHSLAYEWSNWVFSCQRCNVDNKGDKWPGSGYVDPCARSVAERPEQYFDYDVDTGELIPKDRLSTDLSRRRARNTINDLGLNQVDVRFWRIDWTRRFLADLWLLPRMDRRAFTELFTQQPVEYAGVTAMLVEQLRGEGLI